MSPASPFGEREAFANGRFPKAQTIVLPPHGDGAAIYLRATFGVLVSHDGNAQTPTWHWLCERALGFSSTWDPPIAATRDGRLWIALPDGARSTLDGCTVDDVPSLKGEMVADLTVDGTGDHVFAVTSTPTKPAFVWRSDRASGGFTRLGKGVTGFRFDTIEVAASNPSRVYLTATPDGERGKGTRAHIFRSDDGGATLTELAPALAQDARLFISAVDPHDADRIYVRALATTGSDVLLSTDGGKTLTSVLHMKGAMFGFARSPDGSVVYAGSGDAAEGIWRSVDRGATWEAEAKTSVFCLNAEGPRLLVCSNPYSPGGYAIAQSTDRGATVRPMATFDDVLGPVTCDARAPDGGAASACASTWPETRAAIATSAHVPTPTITQAPLLDASTADAGSAASPPRASSSCGCRVAGGARGEGGAFAPWLAVLALLLTAGRRTLAGSLEAQRVDRPDHRRTGIVQPPSTGGSFSTTTDRTES